MNKMAELAKILGVELDEEFIEDFGRTYKITEDGLWLLREKTGKLEESGNILADFLSGKNKITKTPYRPQAGETYYYLVGKLNESVVNDRTWEESVFDFQCFYTRNCFLTFADAIRCKERLAQKLGDMWRTLKEV